MGKTENDKMYEEGFKDGKRGGFLNDFVRNVHTPIDPPNQHIYDKGYDEGSKRRYKSDDNSDSGSEGGSSSCCFITTACLEALALPKNSLEFIAMKTLTKEHILKSRQGRRDYIRYNRVSPEIVNRINARADSLEIWKAVYERLRETALLVLDSRMEEGYRTYKQLVEQLNKDYREPPGE